MVVIGLRLLSFPITPDFSSGKTIEGTSKRWLNMGRTDCVRVLSRNTGCVTHRGLPF